MKHAYLIMAHNQPELLKILLKELDIEQNDIVLHIDKKSNIDIGDIRTVIKNANLVFSKRNNVMWGGFSQIETILLLLETALKMGHHCYYHMLTGTDLPLKNITQINSFYEENIEREFIQFFEQSKNEKEYNPRFGYKSYFREKCGKTRNIWLVMNKIAFVFQQLFHIRDESLENKFLLGSEFFDITEELAVDLVEHREYFRQVYKYSSCCDEAYIQTFIQGTKYWDRLWVKNIDNGMEGNMRYIDFSDETVGSPHTITLEDIDQLMNSNLNFARKFDIINHKDAIDELLKRINE